MHIAEEYWYVRDSDKMIRKDEYCLNYKPKYKKTKVNIPTTFDLSHVPPDLRKSVILSNIQLVKYLQEYNRSIDNEEQGT
jgi:hypothetical protein